MINNIELLSVLNYISLGLAFLAVIIGVISLVGRLNLKKNIDIRNKRINKKIMLNFQISNRDSVSASQIRALSTNSGSDLCTEEFEVDLSDFEEKKHDLCFLYTSEKSRA